MSFHSCVPRIAVQAVLVVLATSCASYTQRTEGAFRAFRGGRFEAAVSSYADTDVTGSSFLSGAEAGTAAMAAGDWEAALEHLERAASAAEDLESRALAGASSLAEGLASWVFNEGANAYEGEGFERVYVHACLGLCRLALGDLEAVYVEARRANALLEAEEELYATEYRAGGFGHLLSAIAYELLGEYDQAWIDYERMLAKDVGAELAGRAMQRLAPRLSREAEERELALRFGSPTLPPADYANVVVLAGVGLAPLKVGDVLAVPTPSGLFQMAVPRYEFWSQPVGRLRLQHVESAVAVDTDLVEDVEDVARKNLSDRLAWMSVKSAARGVAKVALTNHLEDEHGVGGRLLGDLFTAITERADLRAWQTLPASWQAARLFVPPGTSTLRLSAVGGEGHDLGRYVLEPGETMFVFARSVDQRLHAHVIGGRPVDLGPPPPVESPALTLPSTTDVPE